MSEMLDGLRDSWKTLTKHIIGYLIAVLIGFVIAVVLLFSVESVALFLQLVNLFFVLLLFFRLNPVRIQAKPNTEDRLERARSLRKPCPDCKSKTIHKKDCPRKVKP